ncbi:type VII secretion protein EccB [Catenulispora sp. NL8]|uniref:Type VII secretion protein EccB n=1 Tax=Catenulispora pinistramenti TaxID=2705254 RepID=A0ABS5L8I1_9ACTN|nr:type VII secretion protein EccB [Catenulispora pinistramenti]MBS2554537.1 type VII secretion protein EccB [Catenulispora pinistramenti]
MQSRRDHIHAYQFSASRLVHAVTSGDVGVGDIPFRRARFGTLLGVAATVLLCGGSAVYGLISPVPNTAWRTPGSVVVDADTGTRYLVVGTTLRPTANYTSARLLAGATAKVQVVAHKLLAAMPVGPVIGIAGAPATLPAPTALLAGKWALCVRPGDDHKTVLDLSPDTDGTPAPVQRRMLVAGAADGTGRTPEYVVWDGVKFPVPDVATLTALGMGDVAALPVNDQWLAAVPTGPALSAAAVPGAGTPGPRIGGKDSKVGQVFLVTAAGVEQYYVLRTDGLAPVSRTEAALLSLTAPPEPVTPADVAATAASPDSSLLHRLPDVLSGDVYRTEGRALCAVQTSSTPPADGGPATDPPAPGGIVVESAAALMTGPDVLVPAGQGMLVQPPGDAANPLAGQLPTYLIAGGGLRYQVVGIGAAGALGFSGLVPHTVPTQLLALSPAGPDLSVAAAQKDVPWGSG